MSYFAVQNQHLSTKRLELFICSCLSGILQKQVEHGATTREEEKFMKQELEEDQTGHRAELQAGDKPQRAQVQSAALILQ